MPEFQGFPKTKLLDYNPTTVLACSVERAFEQLDAPVERVATDDYPATPFNAFLEEQILPSWLWMVEGLKELHSY
ncbi:MAG: hypothetical protein ACETWG_02635 [Candidatus Neomarinimicrobiota bacterium]